MKRFISRCVGFSILLLGVLELVSRLLDPIFFYAVDTYNERMSGTSITDIYNFQETANASYIFIGSSRIPASINPEYIKRKAPEKTVVLAGRGLATAGMHAQALTHRIEQFPNYLKGCTVFIEYPEALFYVRQFNGDQKMFAYEPMYKGDKAAPHLLLPHLSVEDIPSYLKESKNKISVKIELVTLYFSATARILKLLGDKVGHYLLNKEPLLKKVGANVLAAEGGIRQDNMGAIKERVMAIYKIQADIIEQSEEVTMQLMETSTMAYMHKLITENGGQLVLFTIPQHSLQKTIHSSPKAARNKAILDEWLAKNGITVVNVDNFAFTDNDFPDVSHLSVSRRDEFTEAFYTKIKELR